MFCFLHTRCSRIYSINSRTKTCLEILHVRWTWSSNSSQIIKRNGCKHPTEITFKFLSDVKTALFVCVRNKLTSRWNLPSQKVNCNEQTTSKKTSKTFIDYNHSFDFLQCRFVKTVIKFRMTIFLLFVLKHYLKTDKMDSHLNLCIENGMSNSLILESVAFSKRF